MDAEKIKELETDLNLAKTKTLNFAFAAAAGKKEDACLLHKTKGADKLRLAVKREAGGTKIISGLANVKGPLLSVTCTELPGKKVVKLLRDFLRKNTKLSKVQVFDESGALVISDEALDLDDDAPAPPMAGAEADPELADLRQKFTALVRQAKSAIKQDPSRNEELSAQASTIGKLLEQGSTAQAREAMVKLLAALQQPAGAEQSASNGEAKGVGASIKKLLTLRTEVEAEYARLLAELSKHNDERLRRISSDGHTKVFGGSGGLLDGLDTALFDAVKAWGSAEGTDRQKAAQDVRQCADRLSAHLDANRFISLMENNPLGVAVQISKPLKEALSEISRQTAV